MITDAHITAAEGALKRLNIANSPNDVPMDVFVLFGLLLAEVKRLRSLPPTPSAAETLEALAAQMDGPTSPRWSSILVSTRDTIEIDPTDIMPSDPVVRLFVRQWRLRLNSNRDTHSFTGPDLALLIARAAEAADKEPPAV